MPTRKAEAAWKGNLAGGGYSPEGKTGVMVRARAMSVERRLQGEGTAVS